MTNSPRILGLINARGGSKGVLGKNNKILHGKPLIAYAIESALQSKLISKVLVSTDNTAIAENAKSYGADVPFMRPPELASDTAKQIDAIIHAIKFEEERGEHYDIICLLQPTCPLRNAEDIDGTLNRLIEAGADSTITVSPVGIHHPMTLYSKDEENSLIPYIDADKAGVQRQNFKELFFRNGSVYAMKRDIIINDHSLYGKSTCGYLIPEERALNIDTPFDWDICEAYMARHI